MVNGKVSENTVGGLGMLEVKDGGQKPEVSRSARIFDSNVIPTAICPFFRGEATQ